MPVPDKAIIAGEPGALLTTEILPDAAPADVGAKVAVNDTLLPALMFIGIVAPLMPNPVPEAVACEIVTLAEPEFVSVIVCDPLLPTATEPKLTLPGLALS